MIPIHEYVTCPMSANGKLPLTAMGGELRLEVYEMTGHGWRSVWPIENIIGI